MDKDSWELHKNTKDDNALDWMKNMLYIEYGRVIQVFDVNTVKVQLLVQKVRTPRVYVVRLLDVGSSKLVERTVRPKKNDQVLLLFLRTHNDKMFFDPEEREIAKGDATVYDDSPNSYNMFSGIGILAQTTKGRAPTTVVYGEDSEGPYINGQTIAKIMYAFKNALSLVFDVPVTGPGSPPDDTPVSLLFGKHSPLNMEHRSAVTIHGTEGLSLTFDKATLVKMGETFSLEVEGNLQIKSLSGDIVLNGGTGYGVEHTKLAAKIAAIVAAFNLALGSKLNGAGAPGTVAIDIADSKVDHVRI